MKYIDAQHSTAQRSMQCKRKPIRLMVERSKRACRAGDPVRCPLLPLALWPWEEGTSIVSFAAASDVQNDRHLQQTHFVN